MSGLTAGVTGARSPIDFYERGEPPDWKRVRVSGGRGVGRRNVRKDIFALSLFPKQHLFCDTNSADCDNLDTLR